MAVYVSFIPVLGEDTELTSLSFENYNGDEICVDAYEYEAWHENDRMVYRLKNLYNVEDDKELSKDEIENLTFIGVNLINETNGTYEDLVEADIEYAL